jgi:hypothetical protein
MFYAKAATLAIFAKRLGYKTKYNPFVKATINPILDMDYYVNQYQRGIGDTINPLFSIGPIYQLALVYDDIDY